MKKTEVQQEEPGLEELEKFFEEPVDALDRELAVMVAKLESGQRLDEEAEHREGYFGYRDVERNRPMALFSYCSILFAVPVFLIPFWQRDSEFALHHAKAAGAAYLLGMTLLVAAVTNCAVFLPLVFLCYIPALIGIYRASAGVQAGRAGLGEFGERIFQKIEVKK